MVELGDFVTGAFGVIPHVVGLNSEKVVFVLNWDLVLRGYALWVVMLHLFLIIFKLK